MQPIISLFKLLVLLGASYSKNVIWSITYCLQLIEISVRRENICSYEYILPAEGDNFFPMAQCKKYYVIILDNITILFTKNIKQLLFCLYISKEQVMNTSCCRRISNRYRSLPKHKMRVSSHDMVTKNRTEQFSFTFVSPIMNIVFLQNFSA